MSFINRDLNSISKNEWESILKQGAFRGKKVNRLAKSLSKFPSDLVFDSKKNRVYINDKGNAKYRVDLIDIKRCYSPWTIARINHWISKHIFRKDQTNFNREIKELAEEIYNKLHTDPRLFSQLKELSATELNDYLDAHPTEISQLALNVPEDWLSFSREVRKDLDDDILLERLDKLDQIITKYLGIETHYYNPFDNNQLTTVDEVNNKILDDGFVKYKDPETYARQISDTIELMKDLYKGSDSDTNLIFGAIRVQPFARWVNQNKVAIKDINLSDEDLERLIPHLNYLNLTKYDYTSLDLSNLAGKVTSLLINSCEINGDLNSVIESLPYKDSLTTLYYLNLEREGYDIESLALVKNLKNLTLWSEVIKNDSSLKELKHLENLSLGLFSHNYKFIESLTSLKSLELLLYIKTEALDHINPLKNLKRLRLNCRHLNGESMKNLTGPFPKLTFLELNGTKLDFFESKGFPGFESEILDACKELQKIPFLSQLTVLKINGETYSDADIQDIMNPTDDWLNSKWPEV